MIRFENGKASINDISEKTGKEISDMKKRFDTEKVLMQMTLEEKAQMCSGRDFWKTQDVGRLGVPSVMMCDGPNGLRKQIGEGDHLGINESIDTVCYPTASAMASSFDRDLLKYLGEALGEECQAENVGMLLGPGVNMKRSPLCGRNFEYFSEDPYLAGELASAYIEGLQSKGIAACVKHFAANNQETQRLSGSSQVDERTLHEIYLPAFEKAVKKGKARSLMCAYNAVNGIFCAENKELMTDILRDQWGFEGLVVTDWGAVKDRVKGLKAGVDLEMPGSTRGKTAGIITAVKNGELKMDVLDAAVRNILNFVNETLEKREEKTVFDREAAHQKSEAFAKECAVLLKNDGLLPLKKEQKVAFIGGFAEKVRYQGSGSSHIHVEHPVSAMECVDELSVVYAKGYEEASAEVDEALMLEAVAAAKEAEAAVVFAGLPDAFEAEGCDRENLNLPENQNVLIRELTKVQKNLAVVLHGGSAVTFPWKDDVNAILCMHLGGDRAGKAAVDLLYGMANPSGKLAETWPLKMEDNPSYLNFPGEKGTVEYREGIYVGYRYYDKKAMEVLFPFGHGLSYTKFCYENLKISKECVSDKERLTVSCKVKNTGDCAGKEVVQLYAGMKKSAVRRAVRELKAFEKIALQPGEEKEVTFTLDADALAYYETKIHDWFVESGEMEVSVGSSSRDLRLTASVEIHSEMVLPMTVTRMTTIGELQKMKKGREFVQSFMQKMGIGQESKISEADKRLDDAMGEGSEKARMHMMFAMPLNGLITYGAMTEEAVDTLIRSLNEE